MGMPIMEDVFFEMGMLCGGRARSSWKRLGGCKLVWAGTIRVAGASLVLEKIGKCLLIEGVRFLAFFNGAEMELNVPGCDVFDTEFEILCDEGFHEFLCIYLGCHPHEFFCCLFHV